jgi:3-methyladenine DNA glycosylase AlkC
MAQRKASGLEGVRRAVRRPADVDPRVVAALNAGELATQNLAEALAIDAAALLRVVLPRASDSDLRLVSDAGGFTARMNAAGRVLHARATAAQLRRASEHTSDTVRGWACMAIGLEEGCTLESRLERVRPFADDEHFGVREWAWSAVRPHIAKEAARAIGLLSPWVFDDSPNIRRFATEATRPRGVWCAHIPELRARPELGLPLLEPLKADPHKYVQDSVSNWLNDASKDMPGFVKSLCARWRKESRDPATIRICSRATRSIIAGRTSSR